MVKSWFDLRSCTSRIHCVECRTNRAFRETNFKLGLVHEIDYACPYGVTLENIGGNGVASWKQLHTQAMKNDGGITMEWLIDFGRRLNITGCNCKRDWTKLLIDNPLPKSQQFAWTVKLHNMVNTKLGKPNLTVEEAHAIWGGLDLTLQ